MTTISLIAAVARGGVIGRGNALVWTEPQDQRHFRQTTMGCPVVMGRKTWESLPARFRPLPGRRNVVVTRQSAYAAPGAETAASLPQALALAAAPAAGAGPVAEVFVMGGAEIYAQAIPLAQRLVLTEVDLAVEGDAHFPPVDPAQWHEQSRQPGTGADGTPFAFVTYVRRG